MKPIEGGDQKRFHLALKPYGFADGKYGDLPYTLSISHLAWAPPVSSTDIVMSGLVLVDDRVIAQVELDNKGEVFVNMRLAQWMRKPHNINFTMAKSTFVGNMPIRKDVVVPYNRLNVKKLPWR